MCPALKPPYNLDIRMNNNIAWEVSNVHRTNVSRRRIYRKNKRTKQSLEQQANTICRDTLSERYIHNAFGKFENGYAYYDNEEDTLLAFCLWKVNKDKGNDVLHILLLCSSDPSYSLGKTLMNDVEYYCFENKIEHVSVAPATKPLFEYYRKMGFAESETDATLMIKHLSLQQVHARKKDRTRKVRAEKKHYPMIASIMPVNLNTWKNNNV